MLAAPPEPAIVRVLANPMNRALISALKDGPSYPRELAQRLQATEGQVQKHLKRMAQAGLVHAEWHHDRKTVKLYTLRVHGAHVTFERGGIAESLDLPPMLISDKPSAQPAAAPTEPSAAAHDAASRAVSPLPSERLAPLTRSVGPDADRASL